jgi:uncharacterized membrane protein
MLLFWGAVIFGIVLLIRWLIDQDKPSQSDAALAILRQRYAKGEINKEEVRSQEARAELTLPAA